MEQARFERPRPTKSDKRCDRRTEKHRVPWWHTIPARSAFGLARRGTTAPALATRHTRIPWSCAKTPDEIAVSTMKCTLRLSRRKEEQEHLRRARLTSLLSKVCKDSASDREEGMHTTYNELRVSCKQTDRRMEVLPRPKTDSYDTNTQSRGKCGRLLSYPFLSCMLLYATLAYFDFICSTYSKVQVES